MKKRNQALKVSRETVRHLADHTLARVGGAQGSDGGMTRCSTLHPRSGCNDSCYTCFDCPVYSDTCYL